MNFWVLLWKCVLIGTITIYATIAIWVTFQGARDIKTLFASLKKRHKDAEKESVQ